MTDDREAILRRWLAEHRRMLVKISRAYAAAPDDEDDLMQEILLALWRSLPSFRGEAKVSTWIYQVALHVALSRRRADRRRRGHVPLEHAAEPASDGESAVHGRLQWSAVLAALRRLSPVDRAVIVLALDGATQQDIADGRATGDLAQRIERHVVHHPGVRPGRRSRRGAGDTRGDWRGAGAQRCGDGMAEGIDARQF